MGSVIEQFRRTSDSEDSDDDSDFAGFIESVDDMDANQMWVSFLWPDLFILITECHRRIILLFYCAFVFSYSM